ncbi:MAG: hypothetical protein KC933_18835 [Myxococcales bacterium]|nr:hypothetical protein [Myxococcales bacterium]MCB9651187.1 hypothetical protein [Deltaproteobacteria bacterium]
MKFVCKLAFLSLAAAVLPGCLSDPELPSCAEFAFRTDDCGEPCEVYCEFMVSECDSVYSSMDRCINDCANEPVTNFVEGELGAESGNSLACRLTWGLEGECEEASLRNSNKCADASCDDYCALMDAHCAGAYPGLENCKQVCASLPRGASADGNNTVECRYRYATLADGDATACNPASVNGGGVCGDPCDPYCDLLAQNCTGDNEVYPDRQTCMSICGLMNADGDFDDWSFDKEIDTVQCRTYHAGPPATLEPAIHCMHTRVYNIVHCGVIPRSTQPADWPCVTFCDLMERNCPGVYPSNMDCAADCATFPEVQSPDPDMGPLIYPISSTMCPS